MDRREVMRWQPVSLGLLCAVLVQPPCVEAQRRGWRIPFYGSDSPPVAADGILYVGSSRGELHAVELSSGRTLWMHATGVNLPVSGPIVVGGEGERAGVQAMLRHREEPWPARRVINTAAVVAEGIVFLTSEDRSLSALDARSGAVRWRVELPRAARGAVVAGGRVFITAGNQAVAYELDGRRVWTYELSPDPPDDARRGPSIPLVLDSLVYVLAYVEQPELPPVERSQLILTALDRETGARRWTYQTNGAGVGLPVAANGLVFFTATYPEALHAVDARTGTQRWMFRAPVCTSNVGDPVLSGGYVIFATNCGMYALDLDTGRVAWSAEGRWGPQLIVARSPAALVVTLDLPEGRLHAVEGTSGRSRWTADPGPESWPLAVGDSIVYVASGTSFIGLDARTGRRLWRRDAAAEVSSGPLLIAGLACYTSGVAGTALTVGFDPAQGWLACVDAASGMH